MGSAGQIAPSSCPMTMRDHCGPSRGYNMYINFKEEEEVLSEYKKVALNSRSVFGQSHTLNN